MIDTSQFALPKPGHAIGRVVESPARYTRTKREMWLDQGGCCAKCEGPIDSPGEGHRHHLPRILPGGKISRGRGMGGSKRDDRFTALICERCHKQEHP